MIQVMAERSATDPGRQPSAIKRGVDLAFAGVALLALTPLLLVLMAIIVLDSPGSPLFVQERVGLNGRRFRMFKLRTMVRDAEARRGDLEHLNESSGPLFKLHHDPRVTRVGGFLRSSSLDELPQLWNIVRGDMSLVGPRPCLPRELDQFANHHVRRLSVVPGLTGLWQVKGRSECSFDDYVNYDLEYIENWTFWLDMRLIVQTVWVVALGRGAY